MFDQIKKWTNIILGINIVGLIMFLVFYGKMAFNTFFDIIFMDGFGLMYEEKMLFMFFLIQMFSVMINFVIVIALRKVEEEVRRETNKLYERISKLEK